ncbi:MAG: hypothetical protein O2800_05735, partial [Planctomycetota bacterium]|nr:hypothetical protein [Planctomycetota bacterium]
MASHHRTWERDVMGSFLASLLIALSLIAPRAFAQGGWGELMQAYGLPPAMELAEVDELLAAHAPLLPESTATLARLHSEYLVRFAAFQEKDLGPFRGLYTSRMTGNSDFAGLESLAANRDAIIKHAFSIDASLFDALRPIIQPDRVAGIDRIRRRRELAAFLNTRSMGIASALVADLTTIVLHIPEAQKFRSKWDSTLESYEIVRVRQMREVVSMFIQYGIQMTRLWNEQKVKDVNLESDPEQARIAVEAVRESINVAGAPLQEKCAIVLAYQHKTLKTIEETLPRSVADKVFDAFVVAAYGDIVDGEGMGVPSIARRALRLKSLTDAERDAIRLIATEWRAADQKLMKEVMEVSDETSSRMMMTMDHSVWERVSAAKQDLHARRVARSIEASAAIAAFLGDERQGRVDHPSEDDLLPETGGIDAIDILVGVEGGVPNFDTLGPVCRYAVIPRIPGDQFQSFIVRRAAGSEDVVAALFMDLSDAWEVSVRPHCDAVFAEFFDVALTREGLARAQARAAEARREGSALIDSLIAKVQLVSTTFDADSAVAARTWVACFNAHHAAESAMWILETLPG